MANVHEQIQTATRNGVRLAAIGGSALAIFGGTIQEAQAATCERPSLQERRQILGRLAGRAIRRINAKTLKPVIFDNETVILKRGKNKNKTQSLINYIKLDNGGNSLNSCDVKGLASLRQTAPGEPIRIGTLVDLDTMILKRRISFDPVNPPIHNEYKAVFRAAPGAQLNLSQPYAPDGEPWVQKHKPGEETEPAPVGIAMRGVAPFVPLQLHTSQPNRDIGDVLR